MTVAETYHSSTYAAQNRTASADYSAHAKLTYMSSLSAPDVHQVTSAVSYNFFSYCVKSVGVLVG